MPKDTKHFGDKRRKHHHFLVTVRYGDAETFARVYTDESKAQAFADRQKKSPIVSGASVKRIN